MVRTGSGLKRLIKKRDKGVCALCGLDCEKLKRQLRKILKALVPERPIYPEANDYLDDGTLTPQWKARWSAHEAKRKEARAKSKAVALEFKAKHGIPAHRTRFWDIDHIVPVVEGGGACGPENLRVLCVKCHQGETKKLLERLKQKRLSQS